jgi:hypothetical protein
MTSEPTDGLDVYEVRCLSRAHEGGGADACTTGHVDHRL